MDTHVLEVLDEDLEPQLRDRCNTWPLQRPAEQFNTSPLIHEQIPEENSETGSGYGSVENISNADNSGFASPSGISSTNLDEEGGGSQPKKTNARKNAWGNLSYADLITQAILSNPDKRLTLSQIYDWMIQNVPYFRDKGDSNSSAGWKNSIRHNLSLHSRFVRVQNEGAGKSSWWMINPDAKPGKATRRRAGSMETRTLEKKRGRVRKKLAELRAGSETSSNPQLSPGSADNAADMFDTYHLSPGETFRPRSNSNLSNYSVGSHASCLSEIEEYLADQAWRGTLDSGQDLYPDLVETMSASMSITDNPSAAGALPPQYAPPMSTSGGDNAPQRLVNGASSAPRLSAGATAATLQAILAKTTANVAAAGDSKVAAVYSNGGLTNTVNQVAFNKRIVVLQAATKSESSPQILPPSASGSQAQQQEIEVMSGGGRRLVTLSCNGQLANGEPGGGAPDLSKYILQPIMPVDTSPSSQANFANSNAGSTLLLVSEEGTDRVSPRSDCGLGTGAGQSLGGRTIVYEANSVIKSETGPSQHPFQTSVGVKHEPPTYQELYPVSQSAAGAGDAREVLLRCSASAKNPPTCNTTPSYVQSMCQPPASGYHNQGGPFSAGMLHHHPHHGGGTSHLPPGSDLDMNLDSLHRSDLFQDASIEEVLRHELSVDGRLDFINNMDTFSSNF